MAARGLQQRDKVCSRLCGQKSQEVLGLRASSLGSQLPCVDVASLLSLHSGLVLSPILFFSIRSQAIFITLFSNLHWAEQPSYRKLLLAIYLTFFPRIPWGLWPWNSFPPQLYRDIICLPHCVNLRCKMWCVITTIELINISIA